MCNVDKVGGGGVVCVFFSHIIVCNIRYYIEETGHACCLYYHYGVVCPLLSLYRP